MAHTTDNETLRLRGAMEATTLGFKTTAHGVAELVQDALMKGWRGVCVPLEFCHLARTMLDREAGDPLLVTVANFPFGYPDVPGMLNEVERARNCGADEIDIVSSSAAALADDWATVRALLNAAITAAEGVPVKVILETAALDEERIRRAAELSIEAGALFLKTSTGFHPNGGATEEVVRLLRSIAPPSVGVKASGGVRTREAALAMMAAGADRIGTGSHRALDP